MVLAEKISWYSLMILTTEFEVEEEFVQDPIGERLHEICQPVG